MKKHHQLRMGALCSVYRDTQQIITIDCYPETRKKTSVEETEKEGRQGELGHILGMFFFFFNFTNYVR